MISEYLSIRYFPNYMPEKDDRAYIRKMVSGMIQSIQDRSHMQTTDAITPTSQYSNAICPVSTCYLVYLMIPLNNQNNPIKFAGFGHILSSWINSAGPKVVAINPRNKVISSAMFCFIYMR